MAQIFVAGFELGERYSQICCQGKDATEPVSISLVEGTARYRIPTESLETFLKKAMRLMKPYGKTHEADAVVFTLKEPDGRNAAAVKKTAMQIMGIPESRIYVQGRDESFCAYVLSQPREIWRHQALIFTCENEFIEAAALKVNARTSPLLARVERGGDFKVPVSGLSPEEKDAAFSELARNILSARPVSSVFLVGEGFEERWYDGALKVICGSGRRVFAGNNLFAKGACYRAALEAKREKPYVFLGADKIYYNVGLKIPGTGRKAVHTLLDAGTGWYEAKASCEALLCDEPVVEFVFAPMQGQEILKESLRLEGLPKRPPRATRLRINIVFTGVDTLRVSVEDLGFGELFHSSDLCWSEEIDLSQASGKE